MRTRLFCVLVGLGLLAACEPPRPPETQSPPVADTAARPAETPAPPPAPDTTDVSRVDRSYRLGRDTSFWANGQRYRLLFAAVADSSKPRDIKTSGIVGPAFAVDTATFAQTQLVRGYDGGYTITLLDGQGRRVFRRELRKADFYQALDQDVVTVSDPVPPAFAGYHAPSQSLLLTLDLGIPYSDVWSRCWLTLGLDGQVRRPPQAAWSSLEALDCDPRLLGDGTLLTCAELIGPSGAVTKLDRPQATLMAAFALSDSTLMAVYQYGEYKTRQDPDGGMTEELVVPAAYRNAPNAFVLNTRGQVRQRFRLAGYQLETYAVPRWYLAPAHTYYLLDATRGLHLLDRSNPRSVAAVSFGQMQRFRKPRRPAEARFVLQNEQGTFAFYVDPAQPTRLRYQRIEPRD